MLGGIFFSRQVSTFLESVTNWLKQAICHNCCAKGAKSIYLYFILACGELFKKNSKHLSYFFCERSSIF